MRILLIIVGGVIAFSVLFSLRNSGEFSPKLSRHCPPGFREVDGKCELVTRYDYYGSLQDHGVGGLQTSLPTPRDGFTPQQIDLGRYLFFDPVLSGDGSVSCATCHDPSMGFSDGKAKSVGIGGNEVTRSAPTLWNMAYSKQFFWDARSNTLEDQLQGPLYNAHEMGNTPENLQNTIASIPEYLDMFDEAYPEGKSGSFELDELYHALAAFESSLISLNSRYDQYAHGYHEALNDQEIRGLNVFRSFVARCAECHTPPLFTNREIAVIGSPDPGSDYDKGAGITFNDTTLNGGFKVPTLRNIEKTAPYMHEGQLKDLKETVRFYTQGRGHAVPEGRNLTLHWHIWDPELKEEEIDDIVAFLKTLNDESFMPAIPDQVPSGLSVEPNLEKITTY